MKKIPQNAKEFREAFLTQKEEVLQARRDAVKHKDKAVVHDANNRIARAEIKNAIKILDNDSVSLEDRLINAKLLLQKALVKEEPLPE